MGRAYQAASDSHATTGTLTGGTRRHGTHRLRTLVLVASATLVFQAAYVAPTVGAEPSAPPVVEPAPSDPATSPDPTTLPAPDATPVPDATLAPTVAPTAAPTAAPAPVESATPAPVAAPAPTPLVTPTPVPAGDPGPQPGATEILAARTAVSQTFANPDGTRTTELYPEPVFYQPAGTTAWQPVAPGFRSATETDALTGVVPAATSDRAPAAVSVFPSDGADFVTVTGGGVRIGFGLPRDAAARPSVPTVKGIAADYADILPGVDLRVLARATGSKSFVILHAVPEDPAFTFRVDAPGLTLAAREDGSVALQDAAGATVATIPHPYALDSTDDPLAGGGRYTDQATLTIGADTDGAPTVTVAVDPGWLARATYPVYLDPSVDLRSTNDVADAHTASGYPTSNYGSYQRPDAPYYYEMWLGTDPSGASGRSYDFLRFDLASIGANATVESAAVKMYPYHQYYNAPTVIRTWIGIVAAAWTEGGLKWSNQPDAGANVTFIDAVEGVLSTSNPSGTFTSAVQGWVNDATINNGIREWENDYGSTYWKRQTSSENGGTTRPTLSVTYHTLTATPATPAFSHALAWTFDAGGPVQTAYHARVVTSGTCSTATSWAWDSAIVTSAATMVAPTGLTDLAPYTWCVRASDGGGWTAWVGGTFVYDAVQRGAEPYYSSVPFELGGGWSLDVGVHNGEARLSRSFYTIPGIGPDQGLELTYSSLNVTTPGLFGYGWSSNLTESLWRNSTTSPTLAIWNRPDGAREVFYLDGSAWKATGDHFDKLAVAGTVWTITQPDQTQHVFTLGTGVSEAKLTRITDRFGKQLAFTWNATSATVSSPTTPALTSTLNYPGGFLITSIDDPAGRTWMLGYTGSDLISITEPDPDGGLSLAAPVTRIGYSTHLATTVERDRRTFLEDGSETVKTLRWTIQYTGGKATEVIDPVAYTTYNSVASTFTYGSGNTVAALLKTYSPVVRNSTTYAYDNAGRVTQSTDPNTSVTTYHWNFPGPTVLYMDAPAADQSTWTRTAYTYDTAGNTVTETADALGDDVTTRYTYNASNDVLTVEKADGTADEVVTASEYDTAGTGGTPGHLVKVTVNSADAVPANRQVTEYTYDASDLVTASWEHHAFATGESHTGRTTTHAYNGYGVETAQVENCTNSLAVQLTDTPVGGIAEWKSCSGAGTVDAATNVKTLRAIGAATTGKLGLPDSVTAGVGLTNRATTYVFDSLGRVTTETAPEGATSRDWDQLGTVVRTSEPGSRVTTRTLDLMNQVTTETAPLRTTTTLYDASGSVVQTTTANDISQQTYDDAGRLISETLDPGSSPHLSLTTDHAYDAAGHEIAVRGPDLTVTRTFYDALGQTTAVVQNCTSAGGSAWSACKGDGAADASTNVTTRYTYDDRGNKVSETSPSGRLTTLVYDDLDRLVKQIDNDVTTVTLPTEDVTTEYAYDADGNQVAVKAPTAAGGGNGYLVMRSFFDALGHVTRTIANCTDSGATPPAAWQSCAGGGTKAAATNVETTYTYDADGNQLSETAPSPAATSGTSGDYLSAVTTRYAFDSAGRLCRVLENAQEDLQALASPCTSDLQVSGTTTSNVSTMYGYDSRGNLASMVDGRGNSTSYGYDDRGRMTSLTEPGVAALSWAYNDAARTKTQTNRTTGSVIWTYDAAGRVVSRAYQDASGAAQTTTYSYPAGTQNWIAEETTGTITVTSDRLGRPTGVALSADASAATTYGYSFTAPTRTDASGSYTMATDNAGRVLAIDDPIHAPNWTFGYGANGEPVTTEWPTTTALTTTSGYDALGRLTSRSTTPGPVAAYTFAYNRAGNRLTEASNITGDTSNGTATTGYDPLGRLSSYGLPALNKTISAGWDAVPNRTSLITNGTQVNTTFSNANRPTSSGYVYDADSRMTARTSAAGTTFTYDSLGRLAEVRQNPGDTLVAKYTYDALDRLLEVQRASGTVRFRYQGTSTAVAGVVDDGNGETLLNTTIGPEGTVLQDWRGAARRLYGTNGHHDTAFTAGDAGSVTASLRYDPWGNVLASTGTVPDWLFQGSWADTSTGVLWSVARWYDPAQGAFISEDSYLGSAYVPSSRHLVAYGAGNPVGGWDPTGMFTQAVRAVKSQEKVLKYYEMLDTIGWNWMAGHFTTGLGLSTPRPTAGRTRASSGT